MANFIWKKKKRLRGKNVRKENEKEWGRDNMEEMRGGGEGGGGKVINFLLKGWLLVWFNSSESGWFLRGKLWPAKARLLQDRLCHTHKHMYAHTCITSSQTRGTVSALVERSHLYDWICILFLAILYLYNGFKSMHTAQIPLVYWLTSSSKALIYSQGGKKMNPESFENMLQWKNQPQKYTETYFYCTMLL